MNDQRNNPAMYDDPDRPAPQGAFPVWSRVFTKPGEKTFTEITEHPDAIARNAYIWVFIAGTLAGLLNGITRLIVGAVGLRQMAPELSQIPGFSLGMGVGGLLGAICGAPLAGLFSVIGFAVSVALVHWIAKFLGGQGSFDRIAYAMGAITAPVTVISAFLIPFNAVRYAVYCTVPVSIVLGIYVLFLQVAAVKAVHRFGWLEAAIAVFLPGILIVFLCAFAFLGIMRALGPSINEILQQLQRQGL